MSHGDHQCKMRMTLLNSQYVIVRTHFFLFKSLENEVLSSSIHSRSCARGSNVPGSAHDTARSPRQAAGA